MWLPLRHTSSKAKPLLSLPLLLRRIIPALPPLSMRQGGVGERTYGNLWDLTGSASWEADIWGKLSAQKRASYASYLATVEAQKAVQSEVVATLATAYYQLLMLDKQKRYWNKTIDFRQKSLETTKHLKEAGSTTEVATQTDRGFGI